MLIHGTDANNKMLPLLVDSTGRALVTLEDAIVMSIPHVLLDGSIHTDTVAGAPVKGDVIVGNATPKWEKLARGSTGQALTVKADGTLEWTTITGGYTQGARVYNDAAITCTNAVPKTLSFNTERYDTDLIHEGVTNPSRLTCKTAGKYYIGGNVLFTNNATGGRLLTIKLNNTSYIADARNPANGATLYTGINLSCVYDLAINDYVELIALQDSGGDLTIRADPNMSPEFWMQRIG